jgi:predicted hotdog family 3-hydroxylacyl-ACP dehydratase
MTSPGAHHHDFFTVAANYCIVSGGAVQVYIIQCEATGVRRQSSFFNDEFKVSFQSLILMQGLVNPTDVRPASILPHREPMLLINEILVLDDRCAVTRSVVTNKWPLFDGRNINAIVLIEVVAQTSGIHNGFIREKLEGTAAGTRGWIVGVRQARFLVDALPVGTELVTRAENRMEFEGFRDISGQVEIDGRMAADIALQLLRSSPAT